VDDVFRFWAGFENYPLFMSYVKEVQLNDDGSLFWTILGPAGIPIHWSAKVHSWVPNQLISWKTGMGSWVANAGTIRFQEAGPARTRVDVELSYALKGGALGYAVAHGMGFDPGERIDRDLGRMKELVEQESARDSLLGFSEAG
jgi:uncharacterized membrane protein